MKSAEKRNKLHHVVIIAQKLEFGSPLFSVLKWGDRGANSRNSTDVLVRSLPAEFETHIEWFSSTHVGYITPYELQTAVGRGRTRTWINLWLLRGEKHGRS